MPAGRRARTVIRAKDGKKLKFVYQTSINAPRQKTQAIVKQAAQKAGIEIEIKSVRPPCSSRRIPANPDTYPHFYADMEMYTDDMTQPDPAAWMLQYVVLGGRHQGEQVGRAATSCAGRTRSYDKLYRAAQIELDP